MSEQIKIAVQVLEEVLTLQRMFMDGLTMCCDIDFDSESIRQSGRFMALIGLHQKLIYYLRTSTAIAPAKNGKADFEFIDKMEITDKKTACRYRQAEPNGRKHCEFHHPTKPCSANGWREHGAAAIFCRNYFRTGF